MSWGGLNRRNFPRVVYPCLIKVSYQNQKTESFLTHTQNISFSGACVILKKEIKIFTDVEVEIDLLDALDHIRTAGKVVWAIQRTSAEVIKSMFYDTGIEFVNLANPHKKHLQETIDRIVKNSATMLNETYG